MTRCEFVVAGRAVAQGSMRPIRTRQGHLRNLHSDGVVAWRDRVGLAAERARGASVPLIAGPLSLELTFYFARPKVHLRTGRRAGQLKESAPRMITTRPDLDKLVRAVCDALSGVVYKDDSQVVALYAHKVYCEGEDPERLKVVIR